MNVAQLEEVLELAEEKGVVVREAMTISHMPLYKKLKERIKEGAIPSTSQSGPGSAVRLPLSQWAGRLFSSSLSAPPFPGKISCPA